MEGPLGEYTGYYTPASLKPVARVTAITHRKQADLPGPAHRQAGHREPHPQADSVRGVVPQDAEAPVPDHRGVSVRASAGVSFYVVISMNQRFAGEARQVILAAMSSNIRPKWVVDRRSRRRRALIGRGGMGDGVPHPAAARRHHRRADSGRPVRSLDRRSDQAAAVPHRLVDRHRRDASPTASRSRRWPTCRAGRTSRCRSSTSRR